MKLVSFTVENFRSITKAHRLAIEQSTVLVGPNNEGKSNMLKALVAAMQTLTRSTVAITRAGRVSAFYLSSKGYGWDHDFPIQLQKSKPGGESVFELEFALDSAEISEFKRETGSSLNGTLPLRIALGQEKRSVTIRKKGRGGSAMSAKAARIAHFVSKRFEVRYIPAVRTATKAEDVVKAMVDRELEAIEEAPEYKEALEAITRVQQPVLDRLSISVKAIMASFLPAIRDVKFEIKTRRALRQSTMIVDDGTPTALEYKGDGVKSLAALALMRHASEQGSSSTKNLIIAVEEPESHLHSEAMHGLRKVLEELSQKHQVVVTTHCPVFVERNRPEANIVVHKRRARPAKSLEEIRKILGVRAADNLRSADVVLIVEGEEDRVALKTLLGQWASELKSALASGNLAIDTLGGGTNLSYKLGELRNAVCVVHCFLDHDKVGRESVEKAIEQGLLQDSDYTLATCKGKPDSEIEDLYDVGVYRTALEARYSVSLEHPDFRGKKKWSDRLRDAFISQGKPWTDRVEHQIKHLVASEVQARPTIALNEHHRGPFDALKIALVSKLHIHLEGTAATAIPSEAAEPIPVDASPLVRNGPGLAD